MHKADEFVWGRQRGAYVPKTFAIPTQQHPLLSQNPKSAITILNQPDAVIGRHIGAGLAGKYGKPYAVKPDQTRAGPGPNVPVARLEQALDSGIWQTVLPSPTADQVVRSRGRRDRPVGSKC